MFQIADGVTVSAWRHGTQHGEVTLGEGNRDNHAAPGENFAVLFPDGEYLRAAELFTNDACVDNTVRASDSIGEHASVKYSLPSIRPDCEPGHVVHMLARVVVPGAEDAILVGRVPGLVSAVAQAYGRVVPTPLTEGSVDRRQDLDVFRRQATRVQTSSRPALEKPLCGNRAALRDRRAAARSYSGQWI